MKTFWTQKEILALLVARYAEDGSGGGGVISTELCKSEPYVKAFMVTCNSQRRVYEFSKAK